jgi:YidC/Oxa1 family membrane protein insertase
MEKRLVTAFALSAAILIGWQLIMTSLYPPQPPPSTQSATSPSEPQPTEAPVVPEAGQPVAAQPDEPQRTISVETSLWVAQFTNRGGVPTSWQLIRGPENRPIHAANGGPLELIPQVQAEGIGLPLQLGTAEGDNRLNEVTYRVETGAGTASDRVTVRDGEVTELTFTTIDPANGQPITKRYAFTGGQYDFDLRIETPEPRRQLSLLIGPRIGDQAVRHENSYIHTPPHAVVSDVAGEVTYVYGSELNPGERRGVSGAARWAGIADNYFAMAAVRPGDDPSTAVVTNVQHKANENSDKPDDFTTVALPVSVGLPVHVFVGPKDPNVLDAVGQRASETLGVKGVDIGDLINYGMFAFIVHPLIPALDYSLRAANSLTHNYGWSIVLVTTVFNLLFFPLKYKSSLSMKRAAKLQPKMKELQAKMKKYKFDDPEYKKLQMEQMQLMKEGNPLGGCLPMLIQLPFFWAFFIYFSTSFLVRQQPFIGWVTDLSAPDPYYLLPVLMCVAQIGATMIMPMPNADDPAMKIQRQLMTWVMPIAFTYFFLAAAPSGLVLYWMTLNLVGIATQLAINKMMPADEPGDGGKGEAVEGGPKPKKGPKGKSQVELARSEK